MKFKNLIHSLAGVLLLVTYATAQTEKKAPVDYVNPNIGGIGQLLSSTSPNVIMPYGMMRIAPITTPGIGDRYLADKIYGFPAGGMSLMPMTGTAETDPSKYASMYDHDIEVATPYYYAAILEKYDIKVEYTASSHAAYYRFTFPAGKAAHILFNLPQSAKIDSTNNTVLSGGGGGGRGRSGYFYAELSKPISSSRTLTSAQPARGNARGGAGGQAILADFSSGKERQVEMRVGISSISLDQARQNLQREIQSWDFDKTKAQARKTWNDALSTIEVKGGTEDQRTIFYTSLYRVLTSVSDITEDGKYYGSFDQQVHPADGHGFYPIGAGAAMWGNYRSLEPMHLLLDPREQVDLIRSFVTLYEKTGTMSAINRGLSGYHVIGVALDAYMKGYRDFDVEKAYEGFKKLLTKDTFLPWTNKLPQTSLDRFYIEKGYFPALKKGEKETVEGVHPWERRQAVAVTLETTYDDWCMSEWARILNKKEDYEYFLKRAHNYENVFDKRIGFMAPKSEDGNWVLDEKEFSPIWSGGQGGREYYTEMNGWIYTFHVQQDVKGLINLMGGREKFVDKLNALFQDQFEGYNNPPEPFRGSGKYLFQALFPDMTGLIGQYAQGNEPAFHIPYLYNYAGAPWMTQRRVRDIMKIWFNAGPLGISGDEDNGEESSWYAFSAMGFFPVCPGRPVYDIGSPIFSEVKLNLPGGKVFTITAKNVSAANKYIQSATLNGKPLNKPWFEHKDMASGGSMVLEMGPRPNTSWGSAPEAAAPSMSN
jgi:predicted alpha-1,2-mannosidase